MDGEMEGCERREVENIIYPSIDFEIVAVAIAVGSMEMRTDVELSEGRERECVLVLSRSGATKMLGERESGVPLNVIGARTTPTAGQGGPYVCVEVIRLGAGWTCS
jgi:hypothetical protein